MTSVQQLVTCVKRVLDNAKLQSAGPPLRLLLVRASASTSAVIYFVKLFLYC